MDDISATGTICLPHGVALLRATSAGENDAATSLRPNRQTDMRWSIATFIPHYKNPIKLINKHGSISGALEHVIMSLQLNQCD